MRPWACPQGGPHLVRELETNHYNGVVRNAKASLTHLHVLWTLLTRLGEQGGVPGGSGALARP